MFKQAIGNHLFLFVLLILAATGYFLMAGYAPMDPAPQDIGDLVFMLSTGLEKLPWYIYLSFGAAVAVISHVLNDTVREKLSGTMIGTIALIYLLALPEFASMFFNVDNMCGQRIAEAASGQALCGDLWLGLAAMFGFTLLIWGAGFVAPVVIAVLFIHAFLITFVAVCKGAVPAWRSFVTSLK